MKPLLCLFCTLLSSMIYGQKYQPYNGEDRPVVGLVLSGGAAHGMAHIGVIRMLEELEIPIDYIVGTSMGALVGGMKAMGYSSHEIEAIVHTMDWDQVISNKVKLYEVAPAEKYYHDKFPLFLEITKNGIELPIGAINSYNLDITLNRLYNSAYRINDFDSLPIAFACNTTNIANLTNVEMHSGSLTEAMRKTMSIPSLFTPVRTEEGLFVDGGVISNFPVEHAKRLGVDIVLGSYVGAELQTAEDINSMDDILKQIGFFQSLDEFIAYEGMVDVLFLPDVKGISSLAFGNEDFYIEEGYKSALKQKDKLIALRDSFNLKPNKIDKLEPLATIMIDDILIEGVSEESKNFIKQKLHFETGSYIDIEKVEEALLNLYSTKIFQSLNYNLNALPNNQTQLRIVASEKKEANLGISLNRFNSTGLGIIGIVKLKNYFAHLSNIDIIGRLSDYPGIFIRGYKRGNGRFANTLFGLQTKAEIISNPFYSKGKRESIYNLLELELKPYVMLEFGKNFSTSLSYNLFYQKYGNRITANGFRDDFRYSSFFVSWDVVHDSYDNPLIPNKGTKSRMALEYYHNIKFKLSEVDTSTKVTNDNIVAHIDISHVVPITSKIIFEYMLAINVDINNATAPTNIGGEYQDRRNRLPFVGIQESRIQSPTYFYMRGEVRFPIMPNLFLSPVANLYIGENDDIFFGGGLIARYNLPIGPISLSYGIASHTNEPKGTFALGHRYIF